MNSIKMERKFVNENLISKYLKCTICSAVFNQPNRLQCGHTFCKQCIFQWLKDHPTCPECRADVKKQSFQLDRVAAGIISELAVYCKNNIYGCKWKDVLDKLDNHQKNCSAKIQAENLNLEIQKIETDEENELAQLNDPGDLVNRINIKLKEKIQAMDSLKSSYENTKDSNLEEDPLKFLENLIDDPLENLIDGHLEEKRNIDNKEDDLPRQFRERIIQQSNQ